MPGRVFPTEPGGATGLLLWAGTVPCPGWLGSEGELGWVERKAQEGKRAQLDWEQG